MVYHHPKFQMQIMSPLLTDIWTILRCKVKQMKGSCTLAMGENELLRKINILTSTNRWANQGTPHFLRNPKVHHRIRNSQFLTLILSEIHPVTALLLYLFKIHFNIILPPRPGLPSGLFPGSLTKICAFLVLCPPHAFCVMIVISAGENTLWTCSLNCC
jgi:hypothetical protein